MPSLIQPQRCLKWLLCYTAINGNHTNLKCMSRISTGVSKEWNVRNNAQNSSLMLFLTAIPAHSTVSPLLLLFPIAWLWWYSKASGKGGPKPVIRATCFVITGVLWCTRVWYNPGLQHRIRLIFLISLV